MVALAAGLAFSLGSPLQARARYESKCDALVARDQVKLDKAVARHGEFSREANVRREKLNARRDQCQITRSRRHKRSSTVSEL